LAWPREPERISARWRLQHRGDRGRGPRVARTGVASTVSLRGDSHRHRQSRSPTSRRTSAGCRAGVRSRTGSRRSWTSRSPGRQPGGCPIGSLVSALAEVHARAADARGVLRPLVAPGSRLQLPVAGVSAATSCWTRGIARVPRASPCAWLAGRWSGATPAASATRVFTIRDLRHEWWPVTAAMKSPCTRLDSLVGGGSKMDA
jgi:hypothetical protein